MDYCFEGGWIILIIFYIPINSAKMPLNNFFLTNLANFNFQKDKSRAQVWFVMKMTLELCDALGFSVEVIFGQHTAVYIVPMIMDFIFTGFFLWTVFIFMAEINKAATAKTVLESNKFVKFFKSGHRHSIVGDEETALKSVMDD